MKIGYAAPLMMALAMMSACERRADTRPESAMRDSTLETQANTDAIAGDKTLMADAMRLSFEKGTFDDAFGMAIADSALAAEAIAVIRADPRYATMLDDTATTSSDPHKATVVSSSSKRNGTAKSSGGDALDRTENAMKQANEKLDQAGRVRQQVDDAQRKAQEILRPR